MGLCFSLRNSFRHLWPMIFIIALSGCLPEEVVRPKPAPGIDQPPAPVVPSLACRPYIKAGYTEKLSYYPGESLKVYFQSTQATELCRVNIYSVTLDSVFSVAAVLPIPADIPIEASENGYDLPHAVEFDVPLLQSGVYLIEKEIPFIIKTPDPVDIVVVYPSNTANAYADSGGKSLYSQEGRPPMVSFQRPVPLYYLSKVCLKWFSKLRDFKIGFVADGDLDFFESIELAKVLVIAGHSEYWTRQGRLNFDRFVDSGGDALILSGNTMWWQVRYSEDRSQMICYKDKMLDPVPDDLLKTINWHESLLAYPILSSIGVHFPLGGYGSRIDQGWDGFKIAKPESPLLEGLGLVKGDIFSLPSLEYDGAPIAGYDEQGYPIADVSELNFEKFELVAFDRGYRGTETTGTFVLFQKTISSGVVVNTATTDWCAPNGMDGVSGNIVKTITYNALHKLVNDAPVFSD